MIVYKYIMSPKSYNQWEKSIFKTVLVTNVTCFKMNVLSRAFDPINFQNLIYNLLCEN